MAIEIISNFDVKAPLPVDSRSVVNDINARNDIQDKYAGLKTYVLSQGVTYVYGTDSEWKLDGGGNNSGGNGIYGGSGSLPGDVSVFLGTVSNNLDDRSKYLYFQSDGQTDGDKNSIYNYFYRRSTDGDYDTMAYRTEQKLGPFGGSTLQGPYIEFNGINPFDSTLRSVLNLGVSDNTIFTNKVTKISLTPDQTEIYSSQNPSGEVPITFGKIGFDGVDTFLGYNSNIIDSYYNESEPSYRIKFGKGIGNASDWDFQTRVIDDSIFNTALRINNNLSPNDISSPVSFLVDVSSRDWDSGSRRRPNLLTPQQIVRDIEHKYSKIQMWSAGTPYEILNNILYLNTDGNSFEVTLGDLQFITDIKSFKTNSLKPDFPNGTIITIKFINSNPEKPGFLRIQDGLNTSRIKSDLTDATFEKNDSTKLTIDHANTSDINGAKNGEVITFRKFNQGANQWWEIVNVSRERKIVTRNWTSGTSTTWDFLSPIRWLTATSSSGKFQRYGNGVVINPIISRSNPPNQYYVPVSVSTSVGPTRESANPSGFAFKISVDGNRIVFVQGNFRIEIKDEVRNSTRKYLYFKSIEGRMNVWAIGKIENVSLLPQWETTWTPVQTYARADKGSNNIVRFEVINPILSINRLGDILLSFEAEPSYDVNLATYMQEVDLEVWVPPFSYTAATGSYTTSGGGGVGIG